MLPARPPPAKRMRTLSFKSRQGRSILYQVLALAAVVGLVWLLAHNTLVNMAARGIQSGYDFLSQPFGFDVSESLIPYDANSSYWVAFAIGVLNTLKVAIIGCVLITLFGTLLGVGRFSRNYLVRQLCYGYVEVFRNIPLLLQLLLWYLLFTEILPDYDNAKNFGGYAYLSKTGFSFASPVWHLGQSLAVLGAVIGLIASYFYRRHARAQFEKTGHPPALVWPSIALTLGCALLGWLLGGAPMDWSLPEKGPFQIEGGSTLSPEFLTILCGLVFYTTAFVAEVVRSGIASVAKGQIEASASLGLSRSMTMRLVLLPQSLRVIIPPMTNQYLNLTKNSSLAAFIGYPDIVSIANTSLNQTGRAVECISIIMLVYLATSLSTSLLMNRFNAKAAIQER